MRKVSNPGVILHSVTLTHQIGGFMKKTMVFMLVIIITLALAGLSFAGNFDKPGGG